MGTSRLLYLLPSCAIAGLMFFFSQTTWAQRSPQAKSQALLQKQDGLEQPHATIALDVTQACQAELNAARNRLEDVSSELRINTIDRADISQDYSDHPPGRVYDYYFLMEGSAVDTVMNSPVFMEDIASGLFQNCEDAGIVSFWLDGSGWNNTLGWTPNGIITFECLDPGPSGPTPRWGQRYCT